MKARPILMSGPLVQALLEGRKTQTRRPMKPQPPIGSTGAMFYPSRFDPDYGFYFKPHGGFYKCPYGRPGDLLWVRETWAPLTKGIAYRAEAIWNIPPSNGRKWKPSIFMPRHASRITLRLTDVRVERLQAISRADAVAEGMRPPLANSELALATRRNTYYMADERSSFAIKWGEIYGRESWRANPWVWALSFEVVKENVDQVLREKAA